MIEKFNYIFPPIKYKMAIPLYFVHSIYLFYDKWSNDLSIKLYEWSTLYQYKICYSKVKQDDGVDDSVL